MRSTTRSWRAGLAVLLAVLGLRGDAPATAQAPTIDAALAEFKALYARELAERKIVGSSVAIVQDGKRLFTANVGTANRELRQPVDDDTIYHWASITKTFTGIAIMQLRDRGLLRLDDPIVKYIPELRQIHDPFGDVGEITLQHLMTHSAGFRNPTWPWGGDKPWHPHEPTQWFQLVAMFPYTEVEFKPGSRYSYSNPGIIFLGRVIELLTGDDYEVYIDKNIFRPLDMRRSYFDATPRHLLPHRSASYWVKDGAIEPARFDVDTGITVSNGGLNAPIGDMLKYLTFLMGTPDEAQQRVYDVVLTRSSLLEMYQPRIDASEGAGRKVSMGLLFFLEEHGGLPFVAHSGSQNAFVSHFYLNLAKRAAYIVAFNTEWVPAKDEPEKTRALDALVRSFLTSKLFPLLPDRPSPGRARLGAGGADRLPEVR
jgi:CubicO group peptidase (beta-lactamase class C family)